MRNIQRKVILVVIVFIFSMMTSAITVKITPVNDANRYSSNTFELMDFDGTYDWEVSPDTKTASTDYIRYHDLRTNYIIPIQNGVETIANLLSAVNGKLIRFDTAQELYDFSTDVSFIEQFTTYNLTTEMYELNTTVDQSLVTVLLSLDYVLGQDIDYAVMESKSLDPIGYDFTYQEVTYSNHFTGTFNGQGFEIKNLYLSGYERIVLTDTSGEIIDVPLSEYYAFFPYNDGDIRDLGLINPTLEILQVNEDLIKLANLVGQNNGNMDHVYVIDTRTDVLFAGIRYRVGNTPKIFSAAGIVHTNNAQLTNVYYASRVVVNGNYINKFYLEPIVYTNNAPQNSLNLVYDSDLYQLVVTVGTSNFTINTPTNGTGESSAVMKSESSSLADGEWYFYPEDGYPILQGMTYDNGYFLIENAKDLAFFPELLSFDTLYQGAHYYQLDYRLVTDIDMGVLAEGIYETPSATFYGSLVGTNSSALNQNDHYYIYGLVQNKYLAVNSKLYAGLFSVLGFDSLVKDINFINSEITLSETDLFYSYDLYVGVIAGEMIEGTIENIYIDVDISLGDTALGSSAIGGVVGSASGTIRQVSQNGQIDVGMHDFSSALVSIDGTYTIGGIIGQTREDSLNLEEVVNRGNIISFGTDSTVNLKSGTGLNVYTGGVVGFANQIFDNQFVFSKLANFGSLTLSPITTPNTTLGKQYMGGVIGLVSGLAPVLEVEGEITFANFYNQGIINYSWESNRIEIFAAGVLTTQFSETYELALLKNKGSLNYQIAGGNFDDFNYASMVYDLGNNKATFTRLYNYQDFVYNHELYEETYGMIASLNQVDIVLRFSANYGDILYQGASQLNLTTDVSVYAISGEENISYLNVHNYGNIDFVNVNTGSNDVYIAGFSTMLSQTEVIKDSLNAGHIIFANISGTGNIYVGGFVNLNYSGDLEDFSIDAALPIATEGIINSVNYGDISTTYSSTYFGVDGTNNTFVGGLVTLNKKTIQSSANLGDIRVVNTNTSTTFTYESDSTRAGLTNSYSGGVIAGGVASMVIDGNSRIYDTANRGDVIVKANQFARAGGVLGVSLYEEADAGNITSALGLVDTIEDSVLSNGLNFGNVSAITSQIASYSTGSYSTSNTLYIGSNPSTSGSFSHSGTTTAGTAERPAVYAAAGGVIGYGLSVMRNMLNHGTISSTDVAGGVVGATYALGGSSSVTTVVNITTAVNYGDIKAISNSNYNAIDSENIAISDVEMYYMSDGNTFIFPTGYSREYPMGKRGFGGIFGRLQRGLNGIMTSAGGSFDFIVNANPNIDLIGRLDQVQNFSSSLRFFRFNEAIYYSAKENDTTQVVFSGFEYAGDWNNYGAVKELIEINYIGYTQTGGSYAHEYQIVYEIFYTYWQQGNTNYSEVIYDYDTEIKTTTSSTPPGSDFTVGTYYYYNGGEQYIGAKKIPWITEDPNDPLITDIDTQYIYDPDFEMRTNMDLSEYIYFAEPELLADRFQSNGTNPRPNGMYVLASSAGQTFGSVLPSNINIDTIELLDETRDVSLNQDYQNIDEDDRLLLDQLIIDDYLNLKQTAYSEKANLIDDPINQDFSIKETTDGLNTLTVESISNYLGSGIDLGIDYDNRIITFAISMESFTPTQTTASFDIVDGLTSAHAFMAIRKSESLLSTTDLQDALYLERYFDIGTSTNTKANLTMTLPNYNLTTPTLQTLGWFSVYSEAFYLDPTNGTYEFSSASYYNDYRIDIYFLPNLSQSTNTTGIDTVSFNGGGTVNITTENSVDIRSTGTVDSQGSLTLNYIDENNILVQGYDFKNYFDLYYHDGTLVLEDYYNVTSTAVNNNGEYSITFTFSDEIRSGDYYFLYSYFPSSTTYRIDFDKAPSTNNAMIDFTYVTENQSLPTIITTDFDSYIDLGEILDIDETNTHIMLNQNPISYLTNSYDVSYMTPGTLVISPFSEIISAIKTGERYENGYKVHELSYTIRSESGVDQIYTHEIYERTVEIEEVKKNNNTTDMNDLFVLAEDLSTKFTIDLGLMHPIVENVNGSPVYFYGDPSSVFDIQVVDDLGNPVSYEGINISFEDKLIIEITFDTTPGDYYFSIEYVRDGSNKVDIRMPGGDYLLITKEKGKSAYLSDIRFSEFENETNYPDIYVSDGAGNINSSFNPQAYFNGFDYDGADDALETFFIIDGQVSNVPLDDYEPIFDGFLPVGATIERREWDSVNSVWVWTSDLSANFTVDPQTGVEPGLTDDKVRIRYRVVSEDLTNTVYYDISVTDVVFNVTFLFDIYYCATGPTGSCVLAKDSNEFNESLVIINVQNILTNGQKIAVDDDPANYPTFSEVTGLENKMTQFFYTDSPDYRYRFSRNKSFFYNFSLELPLDEYLNDIYDYDIKIDIATLTYELNDASDYVPELQGKYFYIQDSINLRTRRFNVYIYPKETPETNKPFGLFDFFRTWS